MLSLEGLPEEIHTIIVSCLDYQDAFALKQTTRLFARLVDIPTLYTHAQGIQVANLTSYEAVEVLSKQGLLPEMFAACQHCHRWLWVGDLDLGMIKILDNRLSCPSPYLQLLTEIHCMQCRADAGIYEPGVPIAVSKHTWLSPSAANSLHEPYRGGSSITPCFSCLRLVAFEYDACRVCRACEACCRLSNIMLNNGEHDTGQHDRRVVFERLSSGSCHHRETLGPCPRPQPPADQAASIARP